MAQSVHHFELEMGLQAAFGLGLKTIESCEATVILVDKGMPAAAWAPLRTAWECLFYAAALLRDPARISKFMSSHNKERLTQVQALRRASPSVLSQESKATLEELAQDTAPYEKWPCFNAATEAGLRSEYELYYRGGGMAGAHATERSLEFYIAQVDDPVQGEYVWAYEPNFNAATMPLVTVEQCLVLLIARLRERTDA